MAQQIGIINVGNTGYGNFQLSVEYDLLRQDVGGNYSVVRSYLYLHCPNWISFDVANASLHTESFPIAKSFGAGKHHLRTVDITVPHNNQGNASLYIGYSINTSFVLAGSGVTSTINLPTIPRYAGITKIEVRNMECISGKINAWYDRAVNETQFRIKELNGGFGSWIVNQNNIHSSAVITLTGLKPNTQYVIEVSCKNKDSGLWTTKAFNFSTLRLSTAKSNSVNYNANKVITVSRASSNMIHGVYIRVLDENYNYMSNVATSTTITANASLDDALLRNCMNSNTGRFVLACETYIDGVFQGYTASEEVYYINQSNLLAPTIGSVSNKDINATTTSVTGVVNQYVEGVSTVEVSINDLMAKSYASLSRVDVICMGSTYSKSFGDVAGVGNVKITFTAPNSSATQNVVVRLFDTRGISSQTTTILYMIPYQKPIAVSYSADREFKYNPPTTLNSVINFSKVSVGGVVKNTLFAEYRVKDVNTSTWGSWVKIAFKSITDQNEYTFRAIVEQFMSNYDQNKAYDVQLWLGDKFNVLPNLTTTVLFRINKGVSLVRWFENGTHFENNVYMDNNSTIFGKQSRTSWYYGGKLKDGGMLSFNDVADNGSYDAIINTVTTTGDTVSFGRIGREMGFYGMPSNAVNGTNPEARTVMYKQNDKWYLDTNMALWLHQPLYIGSVLQPYVIEKDIQANRGYIKYSDGFMVQWGYNEVAMSGGSSVAGGKAYSYKANLGNYPIPFANYPHVTVSARIIDWDCWLGGVTNDSSHVFIGSAVMYYANPLGGRIGVYWEAKGRWW